MTSLPPSKLIVPPSKLIVIIFASEGGGFMRGEIVPPCFLFRGGDYIERYVMFMVDMCLAQVLIVAV